jgi:hypothetical protein
MRAMSFWAEYKSDTRDVVFHVPYAVQQRGSKTALKAAVFGSHCPKM